MLELAGVTNLTKALEISICRFACSNILIFKAMIFTDQLFHVSDLRWICLGYEVINNERDQQPEMCIMIS